MPPAHYSSGHRAIRLLPVHSGPGCIQYLFTFARVIISSRRYASPGPAARLSFRGWRRMRHEILYVLGFYSGRNLFYFSFDSARQSLHSLPPPPLGHSVTGVAPFRRSPFAHIARAGLGLIAAGAGRASRRLRCALTQLPGAAGNFRAPAGPPAGPGFHAAHAPRARRQHYCIALPPPAAWPAHY